MIIQRVECSECHVVKDLDVSRIPHICDECREKALQKEADDFVASIMGSEGLVVSVQKLARELFFLKSKWH